MNHTWSLCKYWDSLSCYLICDHDFIDISKSFFYPKVMLKFCYLFSEDSYDLIRSDHWVTKRIISTTKMNHWILWDTKFSRYINFNYTKWPPIDDVNDKYVSSTVIVIKNHKISSVTVRKKSTRTKDLEYDS